MTEEEKQKYENIFLKVWEKLTRTRLIDGYVRIAYTRKNKGVGKWNHIILLQNNE
jgi:hypothetical protein|nr:MAG TPA: Guanine nucleotide exchange factor synembryn [Caudoviricetes sp.]